MNPAASATDQTIEEMAAEKGIGPIKSADDLRIHGITDEEADAFMAAMEPTPAEALYKATTLIRRVVDNFGDDPCRLDHHGHCQAHMLEDTTEDYCTVKVAREWLRSPESDR